MTSWVQKSVTQSSISSSGLSSAQVGNILREDWSPARLWLAKQLENPYFDIFISLLVTLNVVLVVMDTDIRARGDEVPIGMRVAEKSLLIFYSAESACRLYTYRSMFWRRADNILDLTIVLVDCIALALSPLTGSMPSFVFLRILRVGRAIRFVRAIRSLPFFRELYMMMTAFLISMKAILWATVLLFFIMMLWAILAVEILHPINQDLMNTQHYRECERCGRAFSSVMQAMLTFTQQIIMGDDWSAVIIPIIEAVPATSIIFVAVLVSVNLGLMNLILSVIVDNAAQEHKRDDKLKAQAKELSYRKARDSLYRLCVEMDTDRSGTLSRDELMDAVQGSNEFIEIMTNLDLARSDIEMLFTTLDDDDNGHVNYDELVEQLHKMKTNDNEMVLMALRLTAKELGQEEKRIIEAVHQDIMDLKESVKQLRMPISKMTDITGDSIKASEQADTKLHARADKAIVSASIVPNEPSTPMPTHGNAPAVRPMQGLASDIPRTRMIAPGDLSRPLMEYPEQAELRVAFQEEIEQLCHHLNKVGATMRSLTDSGMCSPPQSMLAHGSWVSSQLQGAQTPPAKQRTMRRVVKDKDDFYANFKCCAQDSRQEDVTLPQPPSADDMIVLSGRGEINN